MHKTTKVIRFQKPTNIGDSCIINAELHSFASPPSSENNKQNSEYRFQYRQIGRALLLSEQNYIQVGIPWVWGSKRFPNIGLNTHKEPLHDFIKIQLVGIKTKVLYSYGRDLLSLKCDMDSYKLLHLQDFPLMIRYSAACLVTLAIIIISCPFWGMVFPDVYLALTLGCLSASAPGLLVARISAEYHRRQSFAQVIEAELMRRKGLDPNNRTSLPLFSAREPIS